MRKTILSLILMALLVGPGRATTGHLIDLKCPVCGAATQGTELFSTNNAAGADRDLLQRAGGGQPLLLLTVTCPKCHYSADSDDFEKPVDPELAAAVKAGRIKMPAYKTYPSEFYTEGLRAKDQPPAWVSHALIAEQMRLQGASPDELSHRLMQVVWSMRFEANPLRDLAGDEAWKLMIETLPLNPEETGNRADAEVLLARRALADLDKFPADKRQLVASTAAFLLRSHGENEELLEFLESYQPEVPWPLQETREAISLERAYQQQVLGPGPGEGGEAGAGLPQRGVVPPDGSEGEGPGGLYPGPGHEGPFRDPGALDSPAIEVALGLEMCYPARHVGSPDAGETGPGGAPSPHLRNHLAP